MGVLFDIQGVQSREHGERGIARYLFGLARTLERHHTDAVARYLLNPDLSVPTTLAPIVASDRLAPNDRFETSSSDVYHVGSPFELKVSIDRVWPPAARRQGLRLAVTLYDLIPEIFSDVYLRNSETRRVYKTRLELVRRADRILAISEATATDAVERLKIQPERIVVVGTGVSPQFKDPASREEAVGALVGVLPWVRPGFVLYTGGIDFRKNIDHLLAAYATLPTRLKERHQLIIVCRVQPRDRVVLDRRLEELRITKNVRLAGFVPDDQLILFYQAAELFVFPSLYEGFGLPVAEAMACGAPVLASRSSSLLELVTDEAALFDPDDPRSIRDALERALSHPELLARLRSKRLSKRHTWPEVAQRTVAAYEELERLGSRPRRSRRRIAFISPLPPQKSGVADYSYRLLTQLTKHCDVDAFVEANVTAPMSVTPVHMFRFDVADRARAGYDRIIYSIGNSGFHARGLKLLRHRPGIVLAHDVRLVGLYALCAREWPDLDTRGFHEILQSMYHGRVPHSLGERGYITPGEAEEYGIIMAREVIAASERFFVHSRHAAEMARLDSSPGDEKKVTLLPFAFPEPAESAPHTQQEPLVATFGIAAPQKQTDKIIEAFAHVSSQIPVQFAIVGRSVNPEVDRQYRARAAELEVADRIHFTGHLAEESFRSWLQRATIAVQLRATSNGESSAAIADSLAGGTATIVTELGWARELPDSCVVKVQREISSRALAAEIVALLENPVRLDGLRGAAIEYARNNSFAKTALLLAQALELDD